MLNKIFSVFICSIVLTNSIVKAETLDLSIFNLTSTRIKSQLEQTSLRKLCMYRARAELDDRGDVVALVEHEFNDRGLRIVDCLKDNNIALLFNDLVQLRILTEKRKTIDNEYQKALDEYQNYTQRHKKFSKEINNSKKNDGDLTSKRSSPTIYTSIGNTIFGSSGEVLNVFGEVTIGAKRTLHHYGSMTISSDNRVINRIGDISFGSGNTICQHFNNITICN